MLQYEVQWLPVDRLRPYRDNPKRPLGGTHRRGLLASMSEHGFTAVLLVAPDLDDWYTVLDGNTRLEILDREGVEKVQCIVLDHLREGTEDWQERRTEFVLGHDRMRKVFDEDAVLAQLQALAEKGRDQARLAVLSGKANLAKLLHPKASAQHADAAPTRTAPMSSLVLYGPAEDIAAIKTLLKGIKGKMLAGRARTVLQQASDFLDWNEERTTAVLLATVARFAAEG